MSETYEKRAPGNLPEEEAEKLRMGIESAVNRALEAGWNAEQVRNEMDYAIESAEDDRSLWNAPDIGAEQPPAAERTS